MIALIFIVIMLLYLILIASLINGFDRVNEYAISDLKPKTKFSVIIPFRNEEQGLPDLLKSLNLLNYPKTLFEVIFVDDNSNDNSVYHIKDGIKNKGQLALDTKLIKNKRSTNSPKKDALTTAISSAKYHWIVTTDADCILPKYWLDAFDSFIQSREVHCICGPVTFNKVTSFIKRFQALDFLSLQGATIGGFGLNKPFLCSGANLAYLKTEFEALNGFIGNNHIASGDDMFLLEKFLKNNKSIAYLKSEKALVLTSPESNLADTIQQRLRWASKTSQSRNVTTKTVGIMVFLGNLACVLLIPFIILDLLNPKTAILLFVIKLCIDFLLLFKVTRFFKQERILYSYALSSFIYPFFNSYAALLSFFSPFKWKGRKYKV